MTGNALNRFFGGPPGWVIARLLLVSLIVGVLLAALGLSPYEILDGLVRLAQRLWDMGFEAVELAVRYVLIGAVIVFPVWLVMRLIKLGGGRG